MELNCKRIEILDDNEFCCGVTFYEKEKDDGPYIEHRASVTKIMNSIGKYLSLVRAYAEDEFESDYYSIEIPSLDYQVELTYFNIDMYPDHILINRNGQDLRVNFHPDRSTFLKLKKALKKITFDRGHLTIHNE